MRLMIKTDYSGMSEWVANYVVQKINDHKEKFNR